MAVQQAISASISTNCGYITVTDTSTYTTTPNSRADFGIAILVEHDGAFDYTLSNFTNTNFWEIPVTNGTQYTIHAYQVPQWVNGTYASGEIVYHNGYFWVNNNGFGISTEPGVQYWTVIPNDSTGQAQFNSSASSSADTIITPFCVITRTSCYNYQVCNPTQAISYFRVTDIEGNLSVITTNATPVTDQNGGVIAYSIPIGECVTITVPSEGVYVLNTGDNATSMIYQKVIFELCKYFDCYFGLIKKILCTDYDPCCNACDEATIKETENFRFTLNKMQALINVLQMKTYYDNIHYRSTLNVSDNRIIELNEIQDIINSLDDIIVRCGLCAGATDNDVVNPCTSC